MFVLLMLQGVYAAIARRVPKQYRPQVGGHKAATHRLLWILCSSCSRFWTQRLHTCYLYHLAYLVRSAMSVDCGLLLHAAAINVLLHTHVVVDCALE
jgi:hypothetical protein